MARASVSTRKGSLNQNVEPSPSSTLHSNRAAHQVHQLFGDGQPQTGAAEFSAWWSCPPG